MLDHAVLIRAIAFPRQFQDGALSTNALFNFGTSDEVRYVLSVGLGHLLPDSDAVLDFGCRTVASMNDGMATRRGRPLLAEEVSRYLGYYWTTYGEVSSVKDEHYTVTAYWQEEGGIREHGHIEYRDNGSTALKSSKKRARRHLKNRIVRMFKGPVRGVCPRDAAEMAYLMSIDLPTAPIETDPET